MNNFKFIQIYLYGDNWGGELINIPDSALFYNVSNLTDKQQEWYIIIPINDFNEDYMGEGCAQVTHYVLSEYVIIHLNNITPEGVWNDIGESEFNNTFGDKLKEWYVYEYKQPMYVLKDNKFVEVEKEVLLAVSRLKGLISGCKVNTTTVYINDIYTPNETFGIIQSNYELYNIEKLIDEEEDFNDELKKILLEKNQYRVSTAGNRYLLITKDPSLYEKLFNEVKEKLY